MQGAGERGEGMGDSWLARKHSKNCLCWLCKILILAGKKKKVKDSLRAERDKLKAQRDAALALVEKWNGQANGCDLLAHGYPSPFLEARAEWLRENAKELAAIWAEAEREG